MMLQQKINTQQIFRRILIRNITLPLVTGLAGSAIFVILINFLLTQIKEVEHTQRVISLAHTGMKLFVDGETGIRGYALTGKEEFLEPYLTSKDRAQNELSTLKDLVSDNRIQVDRITMLQTIYKNWLDYAENIKKLRSENKNVTLAITQGLGKSMMDQSRDLFDRVIATEERFRKERRDSISLLAQVVLAVVVILSLVIGILIALYGRKQMTELSNSYEKVLKSSFDQNEKLQHQQWLKTGQSELAEKMAAQTSLSNLAQLIINYISSYLQAQVGSFYLTTTETTLQHMAGFAFPAAQKPLTTIQFGQTLVGQAAVQKKMISVKNVPADYLKVSSSIGHAKPAELLLFPICDEGTVLGVVELGFLDHADSRAEDFFATIEESMAVAIRIGLFREQREKLLKEIQNQSEELQTQQEELRVTNEELEAQTRMLKGAQTRLEAQHSEMEQANAQLEEQAQALKTQRDLLDRRNEFLAESKRALEQKAVELQRASQYKSEFLANMSHELRTPLNSSLILAKLLMDNKERNLTAQQVEFAKQILNSGNDLLNLINDILDLSKVESGKLDIHPDDVKVETVLTSLRKSFELLAEDKGLRFDVQAADDVPATFFTDRIRVEQILKNLLSNSIKFTPKGSVSLKATKGPGDSIQFEVKDTGIGIKKEQQEVIFEAFRQADGTTNRKFGGTGLGLSISRDLARLLGGQIQVESELGQGSAFTLTMPTLYEPISSNQAIVSLSPRKEKNPTQNLNISERAQEFPAELQRYFEDDIEHLNDQKEQHHILIIEDDKKFAQILFDLAHEHKYNCLVTNSAEEGVELALKHPPSAVILDIKLIGQNGLFVLDQLKQHSETRHIPVHVISSEDFSRQALHLGAMGYMIKPVRREELVEAFDRIKAKIRQDIRKVLVVESDRAQRQAIQNLIEDKNLETYAVETGFEAFKLLSEGSFDCMIMDLNLTDMSGFELLEKMNAAQNQSYPPIIVYTGRSLSQEEELKLNRYSRSVIIKGAKSPERLLDEVTLFLHRVESRLDQKKQDMLENLRHREKIFADKTIMIVDDDMRNTFALTSALEQKGAQIVVAKNGEESLKKLNQEKSVDIVLMDIMMPVMDGYEAIREIRKNEKFKKLPIIALTAKAMKDDHQLCLEAGANDYLSKPVDLDKLLSLIRIWLTAGWK